MTPDPTLVPEDVRAVLRGLRGARKQAFLAGGAVRDLLRLALGDRKAAPPQDFDVATDALPEEVARLFPRVVPTGIAHGTVTVLSGEHQVEGARTAVGHAYGGGSQFFAMWVVGSAKP